MPSAANYSQREAERLASLTFFLDYQIGRYVVAEALRRVGRRGWVLITKDENIRRNPLERAAYQEAELRGFIVTGGDMSGEDLAELLVLRLSGMVRRVANKRGPLLFTISRGGTFTKLL
jgi:hypothetical protein